MGVRGHSGGTGPGLPGGLGRDGVSVPWVRGSAPAVRARLALPTPVVPRVTEGAQGPLPATEMWPREGFGGRREATAAAGKGEARQSSVGTRNRIGSG